MDVFHFCWITLLNESKKRGVLVDKSIASKIAISDDTNFDKPVNRVAYLYRFGNFNILFFHRCLVDFTTKFPLALQIIDEICSVKKLNVCSLSTGPGTDIIGFLYALHKLGKPLKESATFSVISKYASWRDSVDDMLSSQIIYVPASSTCKIIQCDILTNLSKKARSALRAADVILMCRTFISGKVSNGWMCDVLKGILQIVKPGALIFFISSKEKSTYFSELDACGSFLHGPTDIKLEDVQCDEEIVDLVGMKPLCSGDACFAVWQKNKSPNSRALNENSVATKYNHSVNCNTKNLEVKSDNTLNNASASKITSSRDTVLPSNSQTQSTSPPMLIKSTSNSITDSGSTSAYKNSTTAEVNSNTIINENGTGKNLTELTLRLERLVSTLETFVGTQNITNCCQSNSYHCTCNCQIQLNCHDGQTASASNINCGHQIMCSNIPIHQDTQNPSFTIQEPSIVIPLQSLTGDSLTRLLSAAFQNNALNEKDSRNEQNCHDP